MKYHTGILQQKFERRGISLSWEDVNTLRRAQLTLSRWSELECGDGNDWASWAIERETVYETGDGKRFPTLEKACAHAETLRPVIVAVEEREGRPFMVTYPRDGKPRRHRIADRERGALKRVAEICARNGLHFYHQTDPRGCSLYVDREPLPDNNYTRGVACCI